MPVPTARARVALLTPQGRGGLAVIRLTGDVAPVVARVVELRRPPFSHVSLGKLRDRSSALVDEVLVVRVADDTVELGCHGGPAVVRRVLDVLAAAGCEEAPPAVLAGPATATVLEARERLPLARTELAAKLLLAAQEGLLEAEVARLAAAPTIDGIAALEATCALGQACWDPPAVALIGAPNAGKSTLFNALLGRDRAITSPDAGTTRDALEEPATLLGLPVRLVDLAGSREATDPVEEAGVARSRERARSATRVLVIDASRAIGPEAERLLAEAHLVVLNKRDLLTPELRSFARAKLARVLPAGLATIEVSARTGEGLEPLRAGLVARLVAPADPRALPPVAAFTERQRALLAAARRALEAGDTGATNLHLLAISTGEPEALANGGNT